MKEPHAASERSSDDADRLTLDEPTRRALIRFGAVTGAAGAAGCLGGPGDSAGTADTPTSAQGAPDSTETPSPDTATETPGDDVMVAELGENPTFSGLNVPDSYGGDKELRVVEQGGESAWQSDLEADSPAPAFYVDVDDAFEMGPDGISVTARYYDAGDARLSLRFKKDGGTVNVGVAQLTGAEEWREETWQIDDPAALQNAQFGNDFELRALGGDVAVSRITVQPYSPPLSIDQNALGNIFLGDETPSIDVRSRGDTVAYAVSDYWDREVVADELDVGNEAETLTLDVEETGYYEIVLTAFDGGDDRRVITRSETSLAVLPPLGDVEGIDDRFFGIQGHFNFNWDPIVQELMRKAGVRSFRDGHRWQEVETTRGEYTYPEKYRTFTGKAEEEGLTPFLIASNGNPVYYGEKDTHELPVTEEQRQAYAAFAADLATEYEELVDTVELWNEPNHGTDGPADNPEGYAKLIEAAYPQIKDASPDTAVAAGSLAWDYFVGDDPYEWMDSVFEHGGIDALDVLTIHPYRHQWTPESTTQNGQEVGNFRTQVERWRELVRSHNDGEEKPIWIGEFSWSANKRGRSTDLDLRTQAQFVVRSHLMARAGGAERFYWYMFQDKPPRNYSGGGGIIRNSDNRYGRYTPKPALAAFATMARHMAGATFDTVEDTAENVFSYVFEREGESVRLVWTETNSNVDAIPEPDQTVAGAIETSEPLEVRDVMGGRETYEPQNGRVFLTVSQDPVYVDGGADGLTTDGPTVTIDAPDVAAGERVPITIETPGLSDAAVEIEGTRHDLEGQKTTVRASPRTDTGPHTIHADLLVDDRRVGRLAATFDVRSPLTTSVRPQIRDFDAGEGALSVELQSNARNKSFTVTAIDWGVGGTSGSLDDGWTVDASGTTTIDVPLEGFTFEPFASYERRLTIRFADRDSIEFAGEVVFAGVFQESLSVDGEVGELSETPAIDLLEHGVEQGPPEAFQSPDDIGGSVWFTYDDEALYLAAAIDDDTHVQDQSPSGMWRSDSIQFGVAAPGADSYSELSIGLREQGPTVQAVTQPTKADNRTLQSVDAAIDRADGTTTYEVAIPWTELPVSPSADRVALSLIANDDDGDGREGWLSWGGNIGNEKDPSTFAIAQLL